MSGVHSDAQESVSIPTGDVPKTVADILTAAAEIVAKPGAWTQGAYSRDADHLATDDECEPVAVGEPVCWCAMGAIAKAGDHNPLFSWSTDHPAVHAYRVLRSLIPEGDVPDWNDATNRTQAEVVAALRTAAEKARTAAQPGSVGTPEGVNQ